MKIKKADIIILISCMLIFGLMTVLVRFNGKAGDYVVVSVDGVEYKRLSLDDDGEYEIDGFNEGKNIILIDNGEAQIIEANCPDGLCMNQKPISAGGETICCLPNHVFVEVISDKDKEVDAIAR